MQVGLREFCQGGGGWTPGPKIASLTSVPRPPLPRKEHPGLPPNSYALGGSSRRPCSFTGLKNSSCKTRVTHLIIIFPAQNSSGNKPSPFKTPLSTGVGNWCNFSLQIPAQILFLVMIFTDQNYLPVS